MNRVTAISKATKRENNLRINKNKIKRKKTTHRSQLYQPNARMAEESNSVAQHQTPRLYEINSDFFSVFFVDIETNAHQMWMVWKWLAHYMLMQHSTVQYEGYVISKKKKNAKQKLYLQFEILGQKHVKKRERAREREPNKTIAWSVN